MRRTMCGVSAAVRLWSSIARCRSSAQRSASAAVANSASTPSPRRSTTRPQCTVVIGWISVRSSAIQRSCVRRSSVAIRIE